MRNSAPSASFKFEVTENQMIASSVLTRLDSPNFARRTRRVQSHRGNALHRRSDRKRQIPTGPPGGVVVIRDDAGLSGIIRDYPGFQLLTDGRGVRRRRHPVCSPNHRLLTASKCQRTREAFRPEWFRELKPPTKLTLACGISGVKNYQKLSYRNPTTDEHGFYIRKQR